MIGRSQPCQKRSLAVSPGPSTRRPEPSRIRELAHSNGRFREMKIWYRNLAAATFVAALITAMLFQTRPVQTAAGGATTCESLSGLKLANTTITAAQVVAPGAFT